MGQNAPRDQQRAPQPEIFWRRRVIALALGIAILGLLAWAVNGVVGGGGNTSPAADVGHVKRSAAARTSTPAASSSPSASASASGQGPTPAGTPTPRPKHKAVTAAHTGDACPTDDVVISLIAAQYSYGSGALPDFEIAVVSTAAQTCTFDIGGKNMRLVIKSGPARVWGSSDCGKVGGSQITKLARGVPAELHISWDRKTSVVGCRLSRLVARPGTYTATVYSGRLSSNTLVFVLRGAGVAEP